MRGSRWLAGLQRSEQKICRTEDGSSEEPEPCRVRRYTAVIGDKASRRKVGG